MHVLPLYIKNFKYGHCFNSHLTETFYLKEIVKHINNVAIFLALKMSRLKLTE